VDGGVMDKICNYLRTTGKSIFGYGKHPVINVIKNEILGAQLNFQLINICNFDWLLLSNLGRVAD
jgi:hypothetical protein